MATPTASPKPRKAAAAACPPEDLPVIRIGRSGLLDGAKIWVMDPRWTPWDKPSMLSCVLEEHDTW
jgi:hypothetical protein